MGTGIEDYGNGLNFFIINAGADQGDIVSQKKVEITYKDDALFIMETSIRYGSGRNRDTRYAKS